MKKRFSAIWLWTTLIWREIKPAEILFCWKKSWKKTFNLMRKIVKILSLKKVVKMKRLCLIWLSTTSICRENANSMSLILKIKNQKVKFLPFFTAERSVCFDFCIDAYALHCSAESTRPLITELMSWGLKPVKAWQALATEMNQFTHFRFHNWTFRNPDHSMKRVTALCKD